jgi:hypothetical protein
MMDADECAAGLSGELAAHAEACAACDRYRAETMRMLLALRALPAALAREGFTRNVSSALGSPGRSRWHRALEGALGSLRAPAPLVSLRAAAMATLVILVVGVGGVVAPRLPLAGGVGGIPGRFLAMRSGPPAETEFVEELVLQHRGYVATQPFGDDGGIQLVSQTVAP